MSTRKEKARRKLAKSLYAVSFKGSQFDFLDDLEEQEPAEFVAALHDAGGPAGGLYRGGKKHVLAGLAFLYGFYAKVQALPAERRDDLLEELARRTARRVPNACGSRSNSMAEPVHVLLRGMIDYGKVYGTTHSARQALHRDANVLRLGWAKGVQFDGFLEFARQFDSGAEAMSRAYSNLKLASSRAGMTTATSGASPERQTEPAPPERDVENKPASPQVDGEAEQAPRKREVETKPGPPQPVAVAQSAPPRPAAITATLHLEIGGRTSAVVAPVVPGEGAGFHFLGTVNDKGEVVVIGVVPAKFSANGLVDFRSYTPMSDVVRRQWLNARAAQREAIGALEIRKENKHWKGLKPARVG